MVFSDREQPTRQDDAAVVLAEQESVLESVVELDVSVSAVLDGFSALVVGSFSSSSSSSSSSSCVFGEQLKRHGKLNLGTLGKSIRTFPVGLRSQITTPPPQPGHQITGTVVLSPSLVVVIHVLVSSSADVMISVDTPGGIVVIVEDIDVSLVGLVDVVVRATGREVVLPSILRIPEEASDTDIVPVVSPEPPGTSVVVPMITSDPFMDALMSGERPRATSLVLEEVELVPFSLCVLCTSTLVELAESVEAIEAEPVPGSSDMRLVMGVAPDKRDRCASIDESLDDLEVVKLGEASDVCVLDMGFVSANVLWLSLFDPSPESVKFEAERSGLGNDVDITDVSGESRVTELSIDADDLEVRSSALEKLLDIVAVSPKATSDVEFIGMVILPCSTLLLRAWTHELDRITISSEMVCISASRRRGRWTGRIEKTM